MEAGEKATHPHRKPYHGESRQQSRQRPFIARILTFARLSRSYSQHPRTARIFAFVCFSNDSSTDPIHSEIIECACICKISQMLANVNKSFLYSQLLSFVRKQTSTFFAPPPLCERYKLTSSVYNPNPIKIL